MTTMYTEFWHPIFRKTTSCFSESRVTAALFSCPEGGGHLYPVSNAFLNAVKANTRKYYWTGRITTTAGTVYNFDQEDMVKESGYITSQCCGSTEIELGCLYHCGS